MRKKLAVLLSLLSVATMSAFAAGCGDSNATESSTPPVTSSSTSSSASSEVEDVASLILDKTELALDLYASATLSATFENTQESVITWTSSDDSVVKVVDGVVTAYKSGTAVVTATAGELVAVCEVTVGEMVGAPEFPYLVEELSIVKGASESLDVTLEYNGAELTVATVEVTTDGDKISVSEDNEVLAAAYGEQTITVTAKFGDTVIATATVKVTVEELKKDIQEKGAVEHFINGKQDFLRESPALASYNKLMKTYDTFYKNLINLVPKDEMVNNDNFDTFIEE